MFSVIIPAYNSEKTIRKSVESVINQTRLDLIEEIIIVDDGSVDDTKSVVFKIQEDYRQIAIEYIYQDNAGPSRARNTGIRRAHADWIALLDADDIWLPNKIQRQYEIVENNKSIKFLGSHYPLRILLIKRKGLVKLNAYDLCIRSMPCTPSVIFERQSAIDFGLFNESFKFNEDADLFQKYLLLDSYYVLAERLIEIDIGKEYYGDRGLSSNFKEMYAGKKRNMKWLCEQSLINKPFLLLMLFLCDVKLFRRSIQRKVRQIFKRNEQRNI